MITPTVEEKRELIYLFWSLIPLVSCVSFPFLLKKYIKSNKSGWLLSLNLFIFYIYIMIYFRPNGFQIRNFWLYPLVLITLYPYAMKKYIEYNGETFSMWILLILIVHISIWGFIITNFRLNPYNCVY